MPEQTSAGPVRPAGELHTTAYGGQGPLLVFCHGLFGQGRNWTRLGKALGEDHRVLLVDLPHHGRSPWGQDLDYAGMAEEVAGLLSADDPAVVVGHSMGGKIAMLLALRHPDLVERLCVVDIAPVTYTHGHVFERFVAAMRAIDLTTLERRDEADQQMAEAVPDPAVRGFLLQNLRRDGDGWRWQMNLEVLGDNLSVLSGWPEDRLAGAAPYDGPVLWVAGADSDYVGDRHDQPMQRWFPRVRKVTIKRAGHWVHSEQPAVFEEVLRRFLASEPE